MTGFYLGAVSVSIPATRGDVSAARVDTLGIGWDEGAFLGWRSGDWIRADPERCHLLIVIRSAVEADNAIRIIEALEERDPCIVDFTNSLRS